jgi:osmoprotectant transport system permease protein
MNFILNPSHWDLSDPTSIPNLLFEQLYVTFVSLAIAVIIAFPIALLVARYRRFYAPVISASGILYTIPSLAAFAFLVALPGFGLSVTTIIVPLVIYSQVVLIRNIVAAINAVDPALIEVGRAMGMNGRQLQLRVVLPLALPVIVAGLRVATVTAIGIATLSFFVGVDTLGYLIQQGFNLADRDLTIGGAILVSLLAVIADLLLLGLQRWLARGREVVSAG